MIKDIATGLKALYPLRDKSSEEAHGALQLFAGGKTIQRIYSDISAELIAMCRSAGILGEGSQPGVPQTSALIERTNQDIRDGTICRLDMAGLPPSFWTFAAPCYCFLDNTHFRQMRMPLV